MTKERTASWTKTATGYALSAFGAKLEKSGKTWMLSLQDCRSFDLGRRASFDHAEAIIAGGSK